MDFKIRDIKPDEHKAWYVLWQGYLAFYKSDLPDSVSQELWRRIHDSENDIQCRVAESDAGLVGLVHFFPQPHTWYTSPVCYLNDLFVSPDIRGAGIGAALIAAVVEEAKRQAWSEVYWHTQSDNAPARLLYDKVTGGTDGFVNYTIELSK